MAVREVEAWLLADREAFAQFMAIPQANFSGSPDEIPDPKLYLLNVIRRKGRKAWHREMLPRGHAHIGPGYNEALCQFIADVWNPERAARRSPSLKRAMNALRRM